MLYSEAQWSFFMFWQCNTNERKSLEFVQQSNLATLVLPFQLQQLVTIVFFFFIYIYVLHASRLWIVELYYNQVWFVWCHVCCAPDWIWRTQPRRILRCLNDSSLVHVHFALVYAVDLCKTDFLYALVCIHFLSQSPQYCALLVPFSIHWFKNKYFSISTTWHVYYVSDTVS